MSILTVNTSVTGTIGILPGVAEIQTNDTIATVTTTGYLNKIVQNGTSFSMPSMALVSTQTSSTALPDVGWFEVSHVGSNWSLISTSGITAPLVVEGNIEAGSSGVAGELISYPATASTGYLALEAVPNSGNFSTTISNSAMGQNTVMSIPNPGATTANFLISRGANVMAVNSSIVLAKVNGGESGNAVTANGVAGFITTSALTIAARGSYIITWSNSKISTTSVILLTLAGGTDTTENITLRVTPGSGSATLSIYNTNVATAFNGTIAISYVVF